MPIFTDLSNLSHYYSGGSSSLNYLSGPYAGHSSIVAANYRAPPPPSFVKPSTRILANRAYKPHLATISENQITRSGIHRLNSPKLLYHKSQKYVRYQKPISINTSDIDVSSNRYRRNYDSPVSKTNYVAPSTPERSHSFKENKDDAEDPDNVFMPRIDKGLRSTIKRDRTLVRLHTSRADAANEDDPNFQKVKIFDEEVRVFKPKWRDNFEPEELSPKRKSEKNKPLSEKFKEKFTIKDKNDNISNNNSEVIECTVLESKLSRDSSTRQSVKKVPSFHDLCKTISSESIDEDLSPICTIVRRNTRKLSNYDIMKEIRRNSADVSAEEIKLLDELIKEEHLDERIDDNSQEPDTKKRKKFTKKKSNEKLVEDEPKEEPRRKKIIKKKTSTNLDKAIEAITPIETDTKKIPKISGTVEIDSKPNLKLVVDTIQVEETVLTSSSPTAKKFKYNVIVEEVDNTKEKSEIKTDTNRQENAKIIDETVKQLEQQKQGKILSKIGKEKTEETLINKSLGGKAEILSKNGTDEIMNNKDLKNKIVTNKFPIVKMSTDKALLSKNSIGIAKTIPDTQKIAAVKSNEQSKTNDKIEIEKKKQLDNITGKKEEIETKQASLKTKQVDIVAKEEKQNISDGMLSKKTDKEVNKTNENVLAKQVNLIEEEKQKISNKILCTKTIKEELDTNENLQTKQANKVEEEKEKTIGRILNKKSTISTSKEENKTSVDNKIIKEENVPKQKENKVEQEKDKMLDTFFTKKNNTNIQKTEGINSKTEKINERQSNIKNDLSNSAAIRRRGVQKQNSLEEQPCDDFWDIIGKRETIYYRDRRKYLEEKRQDEMKSVSWIPESNEDESENILGSQKIQKTKSSDQLLHEKLSQLDKDLKEGDSTKSKQKKLITIDEKSKTEETDLKTIEDKLKQNKLEIENRKKVLEEKRKALEKKTVVEQKGKLEIMPQPNKVIESVVEQKGKSKIIPQPNEDNKSTAKENVETKNKSVKLDDIKSAVINKDVTSFDKSNVIAKLDITEAINTTEKCEALASHNSKIATLDTTIKPTIDNAKNVETPNIKAEATVVDKNTTKEKVTSNKNQLNKLQTGKNKMDIDNKQIKIGDLKTVTKKDILSIKEKPNTDNDKKEVKTVGKEIPKKSQIIEDKTKPKLDGKETPKLSVKQKSEEKDDKPRPKLKKQSKSCEKPNRFTIRLTPVQIAEMKAEIRVIKLEPLKPELDFIIQEEYDKVLKPNEDLIVPTASQYKKQKEENPKTSSDQTPSDQTQSTVPVQSNFIATPEPKSRPKPKWFDECPVVIMATPRDLRKRAPIHRQKVQPEPKVQYASDSDETSETDEDETSSETDGGSDEYETNIVFEGNNPKNKWKSTSSNDSGFDSSAPGSPMNNRNRNDAGSISTSTTSSSEPSISPAQNPAFTLEPMEASSAYCAYQRSGRVTPPATSIPRFRKYMVEDFCFLKVLGKGSFGKVLLAELRDTEYYYAVKCLKKDIVLEDDDVECTLIERKVLALGTKHPYLCHLFCTFQTESHLFFVMEYLNGGDLMFHIQMSGRFPEPRGRFYGAEIVSGLKFLHSKGIVYRDLKLDNILLDFNGHVRIADFGMCKLQIFLDRTADTFCGTPDYMAPEIIKGQHYNQGVDWWSFGVLLYEMLIGQSPFSGCDEDELFWSICNERPVIPGFLSKEASMILTMFLEKDCAKRLGTRYCPHGEIRDQPFFRPIDWDQLERRELEAPFKPKVQHPLDTQYFDKAFTAEKVKLTPIEKDILHSMDQTQFHGFSYTNPNATDK